MALPGAAHASEAVEILISHTEGRDDQGRIIVVVRLLNATDMPQDMILPDKVEARITMAGAQGGETTETVLLDRSPATRPDLSIAAGTFATARYLLLPTSVADGGVLSVPAWGGRQMALAIAPAVASPHHAETTLSSKPEAPPPSDRAVGNAFLGDLSVYEPIYAVYGPGTNTAARIQFSFKYQLFGSRRSNDLPPSLLDGLYFAYTQRMFWDLEARSVPFRDIDYQPELFYLSSPLHLSERATLSGQIGFRHESNGRDGAASRSMNTAYIAPMASFSLPDRWRLTVAPRLWLFVGNLSDNADIRRYRGDSGLFAEIGEDKGLRLSTTTRFNFSSGKGALSADLSYPLKRIWHGGPDLYLYGQGFIGYGENLLDYNVRATRFRIGVAFVR
ncbi:phospholipase A [Novosphingobium sp. GV027]|uniref:phospholipase A n=1 Tax=Novosphingobium sp. GV027 TaxID=2135689 RepID=UPI001E2E81D1|nr:phospholipase A [Novosphingobium sp. GV027]